MKQVDIAIKIVCRVWVRSLQKCFAMLTWRTMMLSTQICCRC